MKKTNTTASILQHIKDIAIIVCIIELIRIRYSSTDVDWIAHVTYIGLMIAMYDLLLECVIKFHRKKGFGIFLILCLIPVISSIVAITDIFTGVRVLSPKAIDIYTLLTLAISLPHKLYISLVGLILKKDRG